MNNDHFEPDELLAPHSQEAEEATLGAVLINPAAYHELALFLTGRDFFFLRNQLVWDAMGRLTERDETIDILTLMEELRAHKKLDAIGGPPYLTYLMTNTPSSLNAAVYGKIVERTATRRHLLKLAGELSVLAKDETTDEQGVLQSADALVTGLIGERMARDARPTKLGHAAADVVTHIRTHQGYMVGVPTGFPTLDKVIGGLAPQTITTLCMPPKYGKSTLALQIGMNVAKQILHDNAHDMVLAFSLEMPAEQHGFRAISHVAELNSQLLRHANMLGDENWKQVEWAADYLEMLPLWIDDRPGLTYEQIRTMVRAAPYMPETEGRAVRLIIVDFLQLMGGDEEAETVRIAAAMDGLQLMARFLNLPILLLSQPNRGVESRPEPELFVYDLHGSSAIEKLSSTIILMYPEKDTEMQPVQDMYVKVARNRHGPPYKGKSMRYHKPTYTFEEI